MRSRTVVLAPLLLLAAIACEEPTRVSPPSPDGAQPAVAAPLGRDGTQLIPFAARAAPGSAAEERLSIRAVAPPTALAGISDIGAGSGFSCALRHDGLVFCWGANQNGTLGNGWGVGSRYAVEVSGPIHFTQLAVGDLNACALDATGAAYCWGDNSAGQLGIGSISTGALVPQAVAGGHRFQSLSLGLRSACGVGLDATTYCWGQNSFGQLGVGTTGGNVLTPQPVVNSASLGFTAVSAGFRASCALTAAGASYCWGASGPYFGNGAPNAPSNVPVPAAGSRSFASLDVGSVYACGLDAAGSASCWGQELAGHLGNGTFTNPVDTPTPVTRGLRFSAIDAYSMNSVLATTCALATSGEAWCWGANDKRQLGANAPSTCTLGSQTVNCSANPRRVTGGYRFTRVAVGLDHACAIEVGGTVRCWGDNAAGELGDGTTTGSGRPVQVARLSTPSQNGSVVVTPTNGQILLRGATLQFTAQALDENGVPLPVQPRFRWTSSDPSIATVSNTGLVTAIGSGGVEIRARSQQDQVGAAALTSRPADPSAEFRHAWSGSDAGVSDGLVITGGLLADEWTHSGTFPTRREIDTRTIAASNGTITQVYDRLAFARTALEFEEARLRQVAPNDPRRGELLALAGYTYLGFAEAFCSGVPLNDPDVGLTTQQLFALAESRFAQAVAGPVAAPYDMLSAVGLGRARLGRGDRAGAASAVAGVPTSFRFGTAHSAAVGLGNAVFSLNATQRRYSLADSEGGSGLPFRGASDPRLAWSFAGTGFNAVSPQYNQLKYTSLADSIIVASGMEARLIEAEALLAAGDAVGFLARLDALRQGTPLPALSDPGTPAGRVDLLFRERAFWLFATGSRLGDVRRLIGLYQRPPSSVLPTGAYPLGGSYGSDANLPVPASARGGNFTGCVDRAS